MTQMFLHLDHFPPATQPVTQQTGLFRTMLKVILQLTTYKISSSLPFSNLCWLDYITKQCWYCLSPKFFTVSAWFRSYTFPNEKLPKYTITHRLWTNLTEDHTYSWLKKRKTVHILLTMAITGSIWLKKQIIMCMETSFSTWKCLVGTIIKGSEFELVCFYQ